MLSRQIAPLLRKFRKVSAYFTIANLDPSRRKYGSRVQCRVGDRSHHRNSDGLRSNFHLLAFARVILKFFRLGHALYCQLPIACPDLLRCMSQLVAHRDSSLHRTGSVAIGGTADMRAGLGEF
jgi:hypothetical protein